MIPANRFLILVFLVISCNYLPEGEVYTEIQKPSLSGIMVDLGQTEETIFLKDKTTFQYSIETGGKEFMSSNVQLNNSTIWTSPLVSGSFELDPENLTTGYYELRIEFTVASETGSLAEKIGAEVIVVWIVRTIVVDHTIPETPDDPNSIRIEKVENIDNTIKVTWTQYFKANFQYYQLEREDFDENGRIVGGAIFPPQYESAFLSQGDVSYMGGRSEYKVKLYAANQVYTSPAFVYHHPYQPNISIEVNPEGKVIVYWNSPKSLSLNFREYEMLLLVPNNSERLRYLKSALTDTVVVLEDVSYGLGSQFSAELTIVGGDPSAGLTNRVLHKKNLQIGEAFPEYWPAHMPPVFFPDEKHYYLFNGTISKYNEEGEFLNSLSTGRFGGVFVNNNKEAIGWDFDKNYRIDLKNLYIVSEIANKNGGPVGLSDNGIVVCNNQGVGNVQNLTGEVLFSLGLAIYGGYETISPDGKYIIHDDWVYRYDGNQYQKWVTLDTRSIISVAFLPDSPSIAIIGYYDKLVRYNFEGKKEELVSQNYTGGCNIDPVSGKLGCLTKDLQFAILNPQNFQLEKSIKVESSLTRYHAIHLLNNTIICSPGIKIKLSDIP